MVTQGNDGGAGRPTEEELIERARALVPRLVERQAACERAGQVPEETIAGFAAAGFFRILQPSAWGGYEMSPITFYRVLREVARGCPSSGWVLMVIGVHQWEYASLDPRAAEEVWGEDDTVLTSSSYAPFPHGRARRAEGGYVLDGYWRFSSGCDHCRWAFLGAFVEGADGPPEYRVFLVPRTHYDIDPGSWDVFGLIGTGSKDLRLRGEVFVPEHRTHVPLADVETATAHLRPRHYRIPFGPTFTLALGSTVVGIAEGAIDAFHEQMDERRAAFTGERATASPFVQRRLAEADRLVRGAGDRIERAFFSLDAWAARAEPAPIEERARALWDAACAGAEAREAVLTLYTGMGARAVFNQYRMQRHLRDVLAATNHITMQTDPHGLNLGGLLLGHPNQNPLL